jgi:methyltransferase
VSATDVMLWMWGLIVVQRVVELRVAKQNEAWARRHGAVEVGAGHYPLFFVLHTGWLLAWPAETWVRGPALTSGWMIALAAFVAAQGLRYWAISTLGRRWNTRILVLPGAERIRRGPYRWMAHPNYVAVIVELAAVPWVFGAWWTAVIVGGLNLGLLLGVRIPAEARALAGAERERSVTQTGQELAAPQEK